MGTDEDRFSLFVAGDAEAFQCLMGDYQGRVFAIIAGLGFHGEEAEDLFQEVWRRVIEHGDTFDPSSCFRVWLDAVTRNACRDHLRGGKRLKRRMREMVLAGEGEPWGPESKNGPDPIRPLVRHDMQLAMAECQEELRDEGLKTTIVLFIEGKTQRAMAEHLGVSLGTVNAWFHKACAQLRRCLERKGWRGLEALQILAGDDDPQHD